MTIFSHIPHYRVNDKRNDEPIQTLAFKLRHSETEQGPRGEETYWIYLDWGMSLCDPRDALNESLGRDMAVERMTHQAHYLSGSINLGRSCFLNHYSTGANLVYAVQNFRRIPIEWVDRAKKKFMLLDWYRLDPVTDKILDNCKTTRGDPHLNAINRVEAKKFMESTRGDV